VTKDNEIQTPLLIDEKQGCARYRLCRSAFRNFAIGCGSAVKIGRAVRFRQDILDAEIQRLTDSQFNVPLA